MIKILVACGLLAIAIAALALRIGLRRLARCDTPNCRGVAVHPLKGRLICDSCWDYET